MGLDYDDLVDELPSGEASFRDAGTDESRP